MAPSNPSNTSPTKRKASTTGEPKETKKQKGSSDVAPDTNAMFELFWPDDTGDESTAGTKREIGHLIAKGCHAAYMVNRTDKNVERAFLNSNVMKWIEASAAREEAAARRAANGRGSSGKNAQGK